MSQLPPAVILAAGESSRFWPLSTHGHKSLHRLCGRPIIEHTLRSFAEYGGTEAVIVQSVETRIGDFPYRSIEQAIGDGSAFGMRLTYVTQQESTGARDAIMLAAPHLVDDFLVINPENINAGELAAELVAARGDGVGVAAAQERSDTWMFGVFKVVDGRLAGYVEKPPTGEEPSTICNMSVQLLGQDYLALLKQQPAKDHEGNLKALVALGEQAEVKVHVTRLPFFPLKYPWHLFPMAWHLKPKGLPYLGPNVTLDDKASVAEDVVIETDVVIGPDAVIESSLIGAGSHVNCRVPHSVLGADVHITSNVQIECQTGGSILATVKGQPLDTGLPELGIAVGQGSWIEAPAKIGAGALIGAEATVRSEVAAAGTVEDRVTAIEADA